MTLTTLPSPRLCLPGDPGFYETLAHPPPVTSRQSCFVARSGSLVLEEVDDRALDEYLEGGEYDEVANEDEDDYESDILYLPMSVSF